MERGILFVDDQISRWNSVVHRGFTGIWAPTAKQAIDMVTRFHWREIYLDHDLETLVPTDREVTGVDVAKAIVASGMKPDMVVIHSANEPGARRIAAVLNNGDIDYCIIPFPELLRRLDNVVPRKIETSLLQ